MVPHIQTLMTVLKKDESCRKEILEKVYYLFDIIPSLQGSEVSFVATYSNDNKAESIIVNLMKQSKSLQSLSKISLNYFLN
jgi:hypothetical protein